jgi:hypothetical protein
MKDIHIKISVPNVIKISVRCRLISEILNDILGSEFAKKDIEKDLQTAILELEKNIEEVEKESRKVYNLNIIFDFAGELIYLLKNSFENLPDETLKRLEVRELNET